MNTDQPTWVYVGNGHLRLWDGQKWTDHYRSANTPRATVVTPRFPAVSASPPELDDQPGRGSRVVTLALVAAAVIVAVVAVLAVIRGG